MLVRELHAAGYTLRKG